LTFVNANHGVLSKMTFQTEEGALIEHFYTWGVAGLMGLFLVVLALASWLSRNG
jgi:hypothetical protein